MDTNRHHSRSRSQDGEHHLHHLHHRQRRSRSHQSPHDPCVDGNDIYSTLLGPTADDTVIFSVQTFLKFLQDTSNSFLCPEQAHHRNVTKRDSEIQAFPVTETKDLQTPGHEKDLRNETSQTEYVMSRNSESQTEEMPELLSSEMSQVSSSDSNTQTCRGKRVRKQHLSCATCNCCGTRKSRCLRKTQSRCLWVSRKDPLDDLSCCKRPQTCSTTEGDTTEDTEFMSSIGDKGGGCVQVRYAITKITRYCTYTTFEVMKSTRKKPRTMPPSIEGVFVLRDCIEEE